MVPDTIEYGHWKTGIRSEGIPLSFFSFMQKLAMSFAGFFALQVLAFTGYEANTELNQSALDFHTSEHLENIADAFSKEGFQAALKIGHIDSINLFAKCHHS